MKIKWNKVADGLPTEYGLYLVVRTLEHYNGYVSRHLDTCEFYMRKEEPWKDRGFIYTHWMGPLDWPEEKS
jgi:hypothetical protein